MDWLDAQIAKRQTTAAAIAEAAGVNKSTISKWRNDGQRPSPADVRAIANALNAPVLEAFVAAEFLHPSDTRKVIEIDRPLSERTDDDLVAEVNRRLKESRNVMETTQTAGTPRETRQDEEGALGARAGEAPADAGKARARDTAEEIHDRFRRATRARSGDRGQNPPSLGQ